MPTREEPEWLRDDQGQQPLGTCEDYEADSLHSYPVPVCRYWGGGSICRQPDGRSCYWRGRGEALSSVK